MYKFYVSIHLASNWIMKHQWKIIINRWRNAKYKNIPFGMPHGGFVLELSKKSRSYFRAGGYVRATWAVMVCTVAKTHNVITNLVIFLIFAYNYLLNFHKISHSNNSLKYFYKIIKILFNSFFFNFTEN